MRQVGDWHESLETWLAAVFSELEKRAMSEMTADGFRPEMVTLQPALDMRYSGQSHELTVTLPEAEPYETVLGLFHAAHAQRYGYQQPQEQVEIVTVRLTAAAKSQPPQFDPEPLSSSQAARAIIGRKQVWFNQKPVETSQYDRRQLRPGDEFWGPAVIYQYDTTTVIPPGWRVGVDAFRNLVVQVVEG
jgi:N-methylhydantoinase A